MEDAEIRDPGYALPEDQRYWWDGTNNWFLPTFPGLYELATTINSVGTTASQYLTLASNSSSNILSVSQTSLSVSNPLPIALNCVQNADGVATTFNLSWSNTAVALNATLGYDGIDPVNFPGTKTSIFQIKYLGLGV